MANGELSGPVVITRPSRLRRAAEVPGRVRRYPPTLLGAGIVIFFLLMALVGCSEQIPGTNLQGPSTYLLFGTRST